jgi:hypothetical protein
MNDLIFIYLKNTNLVSMSKEWSQNITTLVDGWKSYRELIEIMFWEIKLFKKKKKTLISFSIKWDSVLSNGLEGRAWA